MFISHRKPNQQHLVLVILCCYLVLIQISAALLPRSAFFTKSVSAFLALRTTILPAIAFSPSPNNNNNNNGQHETIPKGLLKQTLFAFNDDNNMAQMNSVSNPSASSFVAYRSLSIDMPQYNGVNVPVAMWFKGNKKSLSSNKNVKYFHRISIKKIGYLLARWDFIPDFLSKDFQLNPTYNVVDGESVDLPTVGPVIILAHGYLGSRFDLSHLAEQLANQGK